MLVLPPGAVAADVCPPLTGPSRRAFADLNRPGSRGGSAASRIPEHGQGCQGLRVGAPPRPGGMELAWF